MNVKLGFFRAFPDQDALALFMHLQHVFPGLLLLPTKQFHEHMGDVGHQIHRIIPANDIECRSQFIG